MLKKKVKRDKFCETLAHMPPCQVVMESCGSAHYWGQVFMAQGHEVKLIALHDVKPYLKGQKNGQFSKSGGDHRSSRYKRFT